jgi:hypothetical protein
VQVDLSLFGDGGNENIRTIRGIYLAMLHEVTTSTQYVDTSNASYKEMIMNLGGSSSAGVQVAMDMCGNVRITHIDRLSGYDPESPHKWIKVPWHEAPQHYSSLVSNRFDGLDRSFRGDTFLS